MNRIVNKISLRYRVAATGWLSRMVMGLSQVVSISIALNYLGTDLYAAFAIITGLQGWFALADGGLGSSLQNYISEARAEGKSLQSLLNNTAICVSCLLVIVVLVFGLFSSHIQLFLFHKIAPQFAHSRYYMLIIVGVVYIATTIFGIVYRVLFAIHKGYLAYIYQGIGPILATLAIYLVKYATTVNDRLTLILLCWLVPPLLVAMFACWQNITLKNIKQDFDWQVIKKLLARGVEFWGFAVAAAFTVLIDYLVMSQTLNNNDITIYNILFKGFNLIFFAYTALLTAIWPEVAELFVKRQWLEANKILQKNIFIGMLLVIICTLLFVFARHAVIMLLAPKTISLTLPVSAIILFGAYFVIRVWSDTYAVALQSQNCLRILWQTVPIQAIVSATGMYFLSRHFGVNGILYGLMISFFATVVWLLPIIYYKRKKLYV